MPAVTKVLVIGGGFSGMAAAIRMRAAGIDVDLVEIDPDWRPLGAGITVSGPTLRALDTLGLYGEFQKHGVTSNGVSLYTMDGSPLAELPTPSPVGSTVAGTGGIMRPVLARILAEATRAAGTRVRLGCTFTAVTLEPDHVRVAFTDGVVEDYDLVIGADGVHSKLRELFFPEVEPPRYIGQGVWRAVMPRPPEIERTHMWVGKHIKVGVNPVSRDQMYLYITEDRPERSQFEAERRPELMAGLLAPFSDPIVQALIPHVFAPEAAIDYRPLANLLVPAPWNRGRLVLVGDTVAATTPHLASGAGIGIESGIVLADEVAHGETVEAALDRFHARRWERCRMVIENSARLCRIEIEGGDKAEHAAIMRDSIMALLQPI